MERVGAVDVSGAVVWEGIQVEEAVVLGESKTIDIKEIVWDPKIYPRSKWNTSTIERYADAIESGAVFPPITLEAGTNRLLDGKHRHEAHLLAGAETIRAEWHAIPEGCSVKYYAATLSSSHGDRLTNADLKALAEQEFESNAELDPESWGSRLGVSKSTVYRWVSHILARERADRDAKAWRLSMLGWTQTEIGALLGVSQQRIEQITNNSQMGKIGNLLGPDWNDNGIADVAKRLNLCLTDCYAAAMQDMDDVARLKRLNINIQPYDVWNFSGCHDLMGDKHPGRIPGQLIAHVLYYFTKQGDIVVDPMVGSGATLDACLLMNRKCFGYDIDGRHDRADIIEHDIAKDGWPERVSRAGLIFWDPPYFTKKDDEYIVGSISKLPRVEYLNFFRKRLAELRTMVKPKARVAFLMSDWDDAATQMDGIFIWDYANIFTDCGWKLIQRIDSPLPTQQVHPDIVKKFRVSLRMARLKRFLLIGE